MICSKCGAEKVPYEFPNTPNKPLVCFDCSGMVECVCCGAKKDPMLFRVMGRVCTPCKIETGMKVSQAQAQRYTTFTGVSMSELEQRLKRREMANNE